MLGPGTYSRIYDVVRRIPPGRVATYGQVAELAGLPGHARQVGYALHALKDEEVPWHRVVNAQGRVSARSDPGCDGWQRELLEGEGILFDETGRVALQVFGWEFGISGFRERDSGIPAFGKSGNRGML